MSQFEDDDLVWAPWKRLWWPAKVLGKSSWPVDLNINLDNLIAVVHYLGENGYDIITNDKKLYYYTDVTVKEDFLRLGAKISDRSLRGLFEYSVKLAQEAVGQEPVNLRNFVTRPQWATLFSSPGKKSEKKEKQSLDSENNMYNKKINDLHFNKKRGRKSKLTPKQPILHPRFQPGSEHKVFIREQPSDFPLMTENDTSQPFHCDICDFRTARLNNLTVHARTHKNAPETPKRVPLKTRVSRSKKSSKSQNIKGSSHTNEELKRSLLKDWSDDEAELQSRNDVLNTSSQKILTAEEQFEALLNSNYDNTSDSKLNSFTYINHLTCESNKEPSVSFSMHHDSGSRSPSSYEEISKEQDPHVSSSTETT